MRAVGDHLRQMREDAGRSQAAVARAAGVSPGHLSRIEAGEAEPSELILERLGVALGAELGVRYFPNTGPRIRDRIQVAMSEALLAALHPRWRATPEVAVYRPVRGVIDVVLEEVTGPETVSTELHSQLRRVEQLIRWQTAKRDALAALPGQQERVVGRLLVLRNTHAVREVVAAAAGTLGAAYPAPARDAVGALRGDRPWPGSAIVWMRVDHGVAHLLDRPPRGVAVGR